MYWKHEPVLNEQEKELLKIADKLYEVYYMAAISEHRSIATSSEGTAYTYLRAQLREFMQTFFELTESEYDILDDLMCDTGEPPSFQLANIPAKLIERL